MMVLSLLLLFFLGCSFAISPPGGGSDYVMYSIGDYIRNASPSIWYSPWELRPIIGTYHLAPEVVEKEMMTMMDRGQDGITLVLWFAPLSQGLDNVYGHVVNCSEGILAPQHQENLANVMQLITKVGFKKVFFRFATQFDAHPFNWDSWQEDQYQENYVFMKQVRQIIYANFDTSKIPLLFDLCLETGGVHLGLAQNYTQRMWQDYTTEFGNEDTYGFTMAYGNMAQCVAYAIEVYDAVGVRPIMYAFDFYGQEQQALIVAYTALVRYGEGSKPVLIQECFLNDVIAYSGIMTAVEQLNIPLVGIYQWPLSRSSNHTAFSVDYSPDYTAFLFNVSGTIQAYPNPCQINSQDSACTSNISWQTGNANEACIFVITEDNQPKLFTCGASGSENAPWISQNWYYNFELRQTNDPNSLLLASVNVTAAS